MGISISHDGLRMPGLTLDHNGIQMPGLTLDHNGLKTPIFVIDHNGAHVPSLSYPTQSNSYVKPLLIGGVIGLMSGAGLVWAIYSKRDKRSHK
jgi:hypothetical protein